MQRNGDISRTITIPLSYKRLKKASLTNFEFNFL
jgi:hypothetical protein